MKKERKIHLFVWSIQLETLFESNVNYIEMHVENSKLNNKYYFLNDNIDVGLCGNFVIPVAIDISMLGKNISLNEDTIAIAYNDDGERDLRHEALKHIFKILSTRSCEHEFNLARFRDSYSDEVGEMQRTFYDL